jgi:predicted outer membrane lipoprotein
MDTLLLAAFAVMAALTLALAEFCDALQQGDQT